MKQIILFALIFGFFGSLTAQADNCDKPRDDFDGLYCLNKVYSQADKDLNDVYQKLLPKLDAEGRSLLKTRQLAWIETRNSQCGYRSEKGFFVNLNCATKSTINQLHFLQDRYRECASAGCMNSRLKQSVSVDAAPGLK